MKTKNDYKKYLIMGLCSILIVMAVGYAAFSSLLTINGTATLSNSFCVGFDNTKLNTYAPTPSTFTGTIYRNNSNVLFNGLTFDGEATVWYPTSNYSSASEAFADSGVFSSQSYCEAVAEDSCSSGTVTMSAGSYETTPDNLNKPYYLKHTITNDIVTASYVCFVTDTDHCMQGGEYNPDTDTSLYYSANRSLLEGQEAWFNNHSGSCYFESGSGCDGDGLLSVGATSYSYVSATVYHVGYREVNTSSYSICEDYSESEFPE